MRNVVKSSAVFPIARKLSIVRGCHCIHYCFPRGRGSGFTSIPRQCSTSFDTELLSKKQNKTKPVGVRMTFKISLLLLLLLLLLSTGPRRVHHSPQRQSLPTKPTHPPWQTGCLPTSDRRSPCRPADRSRVASTSRQPQAPCGPMGRRGAGEGKRSRCSSRCCGAPMSSSVRLVVGWRSCSAPPAGVG